MRTLGALKSDHFFSVCVYINEILAETGFSSCNRESFTPQGMSYHGSTCASFVLLLVK